MLFIARTPLNRRLALAVAFGLSALGPWPGIARASEGAAAELGRAYAHKAERRFVDAARAFERARDEGADPQLVELELAYVAAARGDLAEARRRYDDAQRGANHDIAKRARAELDALGPPSAPPAAREAQPLPAEIPPLVKATAPPPQVVVKAEAEAGTPAGGIDDGYRAKAAGNLEEAARAFERARTRGESPQLASMELGYLAAAGGDPDLARARFTEAASGPDTELSARALRERSALPRHVHADLYADAFGASRLAGERGKSVIVPLVRVRAFYRPVLSVPVEAYVAAQVVRDTASHGFSGAALPQIYADNYANFGAGVRVRLWRRVELFGQVGPAINLLDDGRDRATLDVRGGGLAFLESSRCVLPVQGGVRAGLWPCLETYAEAVYVHRFEDNVIGFLRPRVGLGWLMSGPVLWQVLAEARAAKDVNDDYWNNFADGGLGHRWRLLSPFRLDLVASANAGSYFGLAGRDPAPARLSYVDARLLATTYVEF